MTRSGFAVFMAAIAVIIVALMWLGWRARSKRDASISLSAVEIAGAVLAEFTGVQYVSTTPIGLPLERVSIRGLQYKGLASLLVREGGVALEVTGEQTVSIPGDHIIGVSRSNGRVGKAVEAGGLSVLEWRSVDGRDLESGFRFSDQAEQRAFEAAVHAITDNQTQTTAPAGQADVTSSQTFTDMTQEDA